MHSDITNVVTVFFNRFDFLCSVVVENPQQVIVAADDDPLLSCDELSATHGRVRDLDGAYLSLRVVVVYHDSTSVECGQHPGKVGMQVD